jgi:adenylosuccinate synthase
MIDGVTQLIMMKSDVLDTFETIRACIGYEINGEKVTDFPFEVDERIKPIYVDMKGWQTDMTKMQKEDEFPAEFKHYISFLEKELQVPIKIVSLGPDREQTIIR